MPYAARSRADSLLSAFVAINARKHDTQVRGSWISRIREADVRWLFTPTSLNRFSRAILSDSSSLKSTYWPACTFSTTFAGTGGRADESRRGPSVLVVGVAGGIAVMAGLVVVVARVAPMLVLTAGVVLVWSANENIGIEVSDAGSGIVEPSEIRPVMIEKLTITESPCGYMVFSVTLR